MNEDSIRRAFQDCDSEICQAWQQKHLRLTYEPLLTEPYLIDIDTTVKPLYGKQERDEIGFNPKKPGRPSHVYHTHFIANLRLVMDSEVQAGNRQDHHDRQDRPRTPLERAEFRCFSGRAVDSLYDLLYYFTLANKKAPQATLGESLELSNETTAWHLTHSTRR